MDTVWKFNILEHILNDGAGDFFDLHLAEEAVPLSVQIQGNAPQMWVRTPEDAILPEYPTPTRRFYICGTGHPLHPKAGKHLDTFQMQGLVFHVFEEKEDA